MCAYSSIHPQKIFFLRSIAGLGFILPGFCMLLALTLLYQHYGALPRIRHAFCGHGALAP